MEQVAYNYLAIDRLLHIDMLELIRLKEAKIIRAGEDGVLIYHIPGGIYMLSAASEKSAWELAGLMENPQTVLLHQPYMKDEIREHFFISRTMICYQAAWLKDEPVIDMPSNTDLRMLTEKDLPVVRLHYTTVDGPEYIKDRLDAGMLGAFVNGELAGFIGTHPEGSIGMLEVLPAYRRRGLALVLETAMMKRLQSLGRIPYAQIKEGNEASIALHRKLGMEITIKPSLCWLF